MVNHRLQIQPTGKMREPFSPSAYIDGRAGAKLNASDGKVFGEENRYIELDV
jgi:hypothetical protein